MKVSDVAHEKFSSIQVVLPALPSSISASELILAQQHDSSLADLFANAKSAEEMQSIANGYFTQDGMLVRKWTSCSDKVVGEPLFQIVVPTGFRDVVLQTAHADIAGHFGVRKTYDRVLHNFFFLVAS